MKYLVYYTLNNRIFAEAVESESGNPEVLKKLVIPSKPNGAEYRKSEINYSYNKRFQETGTTKDVTDQYEADQAFLRGCGNQAETFLGSLTIQSE